MGFMSKIARSIKTKKTEQLLKKAQKVGWKGKATHFFFTNPKRKL